MLTTVDTYRPRFFFKQEWRWHVLMMPFLIALVNMYLIGPLHFTNRLAFAAGSMLAFGLYWVPVVLLTLGVRQPIRYYPGMQQTVLRTLVMLGWVGSFTLILAIIYVSAYSLVSATKVAFSWTLVQSICIAGLLADAFLCIILGLSYTYSQWKVELQEDEQWQRQALQRQYDALKGQLNPRLAEFGTHMNRLVYGEQFSLGSRFHRLYSITVGVNHYIKLSLLGRKSSSYLTRSTRAKKVRSTTLFSNTIRINQAG